MAPGGIVARVCYDGRQLREADDLLLRVTMMVEVGATRESTNDVRTTRVFGDVCSLPPFIRCVGPDVRREAETRRRLAAGQDGVAPDRAHPGGVIVRERPPRVTQLPTNCHTCLQHNLPNAQAYEQSALAHCLSSAHHPRYWGHDG